MSESGESLGTRTIRGMAWAYGAYVGGRLLVLVAMAILTRLLTPEDFGVVALTMTFLVFLDAVRDLGLAQAVIVGDARDAPERAQTAFSWSVLIGLLLTLATIALAPAVASFFDEPEQRYLLPLMGSTFLIRGLGSTHYALARKSLDYRVRTVSELADVIVRGVVGIALALLDLGALALVVGYVAGAVASTLSLWALVSFRPRPRLSRLHLREMLAFGGMLTVVDIGAVLVLNLDYVFIGKILGASALGFFTIAFRLPELAIVNLATVAGDVLFPAYAIADRARLRTAYLAALRYTAMLTLPIAVVLIVLAQPLILALFGDQWGESAPVMQLLALGALLATLTIPPGTVFKVTNRAWILVAATIPDLIAYVILLSIYTDDGIHTVALINVLLGAIPVPILAVVASLQLRLPLLASVHAVLPALAGAGAMGLAMLGTDQLVSGTAVTLIVVPLVGALVYVAMLVVFAREDLERLRRMAFPQRVRSSGAT